MVYIFRRHTNREDLLFYQKAKSLYVIAYFSAHEFLRIGDRTIDQMAQAAQDCFPAANTVADAFNFRNKYG